MSNALDMVNQLDNDAIVIELEDREAALEKWQSAKRIAEKQLAKAPTPEWNYIAGYLCYMLFSRDACSFTIVERYLVDALSPSPKQGLAQFYLASLYFDSGRFKSAIPQLERIYKAGKGYFKKLSQEWRYVKSVEMLVAAHIRNESWFEARTIGLQLEGLYRGCEDYESMIPVALVGTLEEVASHGPAYEDLCTIAAGLVRLTHTERATMQLFPGFSRKWVQATDE